MRNISLPPGFDPRIVQTVASRYTDYAISAHLLLRVAALNLVLWSANARDPTNAVCEIAENSEASKMKTECVSLVNYEIQHAKLLVATTMWYDILLAVNTAGKTLQFCKTKIQVTLQQNKWLVNFLQKIQNKKRVSPLSRWQQYKWPRKRKVNQNSEVTRAWCFYTSTIDLSWQVPHDKQVD
jgi:hypothetical protein